MEGGRKTELFQFSDEAWWVHGAAHDVPGGVGEPVRLAPVRRQQRLELHAEKQRRFSQDKPRLECFINMVGQHQGGLKTVQGPKHLRTRVDEALNMILVIYYIRHIVFKVLKNFKMYVLSSLLRSTQLHLTEVKQVQYPRIMPEVNLFSFPSFPMETLDLFNKFLFFYFLNIISDSNFYHRIFLDPHSLI